MTRKKTGVTVLLLASLLLVMLPPVALAQSPLPSNFYGSVTVDGQNVPAGTTIVIYVGGAPIVGATTQDFQGRSVYSVNVPGDDPSTAAVEGGKAGDDVYFAIGNLHVATQIGKWATGTNVSLNLTASSAPPATATPAAAAGVADQLASLGTKLVMVITYEPSDTADPWKIYDPAAPIFANDLPRLQAGNGYWIYSNAATTLTYGGTTYNLARGWNLLGWLGSASPAATPTPARTATPIPPPSGPQPSSVADAVAKAMPAVVRIEVRASAYITYGSGFIIDAQGNIVTNNHVVEDGNTATVTLPDGRAFTGTVVGRDATADIAVVRITGTNLPTVAMGDSDALRLGEDVVAIGYPYGLGGSATITRGIVSAKRFNTAMGVNVIQTDAAINPGNSGGPLINLRGEVVGINTYGLTVEGERAEGMGFAISINSARPIIQRILSGQATPAPTATPVTRPTATPTRATASGILFEDNFDDNRNGWPLGITPNVGQGYLEGGKYHLVNNNTLLSIWARPSTAASFADFSYEAIVAKVDGSDSYGYGIDFRHVLRQGSYSFAIAGDGAFILAKYTYDPRTGTYEPSTLIPWTPSSAINRGNSTNRLKVVARGATIQLYANDQYLTQFADGPNFFSAGGIGLIGRPHVAFDYVVVRSLDAGGVAPTPTRTPTPRPTATPSTTAIGTPALLYPLSAPGFRLEVASNTPTFSWTNVANATGYEIQIAAEGNTATYSGYPNSGNGYMRPLITATTTDISYAIPSNILQTGGVYYWHVRAIFGTVPGAWGFQAGGASGGSGVFKIAGALPAPTPTATTIPRLTATPTPTPSVRVVASFSGRSSGDTPSFALAPGAFGIVYQ